MKKLQKIFSRQFSKKIVKNPEIDLKILFENSKKEIDVDKEFFEETELIHKDENEIILQKTYYVTDYKKYFDSDFFFSLEILAKYIIWRNTKIQELEYKYILNLIIKKNWVSELLKNQEEALLILIKIISEIYFSTFENLYKITFLASEMGLLSNKEVLLNIFTELNRIFFYDKNTEYKRISLPFTNAYEHNFEKYLEAKKKLKYNEEISDLASYCKNVKTLINTKERKFKDYYEEYKYKDKFFVFNTEKFNSLQIQNSNIIDQFLDIVEIIYKQFSLNPDLISEKIEKNNSYTNFEINFGKLIKIISLKEILRFLDIIYKYIVILNSNLEEVKTEENLLAHILNSTKLEIIDIRLYENLDLLEIKDIIFYFYLISKTFYKDSLFLKIVPEIFQYYFEFFKKNFAYFSIVIYSLGILKVSDKKLWVFLNKFLQDCYFFKSDFFFYLDKNKLIPVLITFSQFYPQRNIWLKL